MKIFTNIAIIVPQLVSVSMAFKHSKGLSI